MDYKTLHLLLKCGKEFGHRRLRDHGLNDTESLLCSYIYHNPACSQEEAARALHLDKTTTAKALSALEKKGFITRQRNAADGRRNDLLITAAGTDCLKAISEYHSAWINEVFSCLSPEEQETFDGLFCRVLKKAEERLDREDA